MGSIRSKTALGLFATVVLAVIATPALVIAQDEEAVAEEQAAAELTAAVLGDETVEKTHERALGLYWDDKLDGYVIVVPSTGSVPKASDYEGFGIPVRIKEIDLTPAELAAIESDVLDLMQRKAENKGYSFTGYFDARTGKYTMRGTAPHSEMAALLAKHQRLVYEKDEPVVEWNRDNDAAPHSGGAKLNIGIDGICTSGFTVQRIDNGVEKMVTAGHCADVGEQVDGPTGNSWGTMNKKAPWPARDSGFLGGSTYKGWIYVGPDGTTIERVESAHNPAVDKKYCFSGGWSKQSCGHTVLTLNAQWCRRGGCGTGFVQATNDGSGGNGDSGAPFFQANGNTNKIRGILLGGNDDLIVVEKWSVIRDELGVNIVTN